ncbi:hypothetical protein WJX77_005643 [Trebouxia sp. C0004]
MGGAIPSSRNVQCWDEALGLARKHHDILLEAMTTKCMGGVAKQFGMLMKLGMAWRQAEQGVDGGWGHCWHWLPSFWQLLLTGEFGHLPQQSLPSRMVVAPSFSTVLYGARSPSADRTFFVAAGCDVDVLEDVLA